MTVTGDQCTMSSPSLKSKRHPHEHTTGSPSLPRQMTPACICCSTPAQCVVRDTNQTKVRSADRSTTITWKRKDSPDRAAGGPRRPRSGRGANAHRPHSGAPHPRSAPTPRPLAALAPQGPGPDVQLPGRLAPPACGNSPSYRWLQPALAIPAPLAARGAD
jgi:hypothetical protein